MFNTPILFIIFNRPGVTQIVFEQIRKVQPKFLFIAADGPRKERAGEAEQCEETRKIIKEIDWDCDLKILFRESNIGCAKNVSGAISWFFEHVESGIILEDDCLPQDTFFSFCETMLDYYKNHDKIMAISGYNSQLGIPRSKYSYFFAEIPLVWGWATWKNAWQRFEFTVDKIDESVFNTTAKKMWFPEIEKAYQGKIDSWAYRWIYSFMKNKFLCVYPAVSLINNIGIGGDSTHTHGQRWWYKEIRYGELTNITHPPTITISADADELTSRINMAKQLTFTDRLKRIFYKRRR